MKRIGTVLLALLLLASMLFMSACSFEDIQSLINGGASRPLDVPTNLRVEGTVLKWNAVEYASGYTVLVNNTTTYACTENSYSLQSLPSGEYTLAVKANGDGVMYKTSEYSDAISYTRNTDTGKEYEDEIKGAFGSFDEMNTRNSYLGYGIDIINASAVTSKNVKVNYPIFDMDKLMNETLLKSNEHYNTFESIEGITIQSFVESMSNSSSVTSGSHVSAKGNLYGADVGASVSMSSGLSTVFTKTSETVAAQYFMEVIAENQSYWLILQTDEQRYKDILSEEFKRDLYDTSITPAQLFSKYGTHLLTSVAMGGNICMYYTMFTYDNKVTETDFAKVSSELKANVEASYGKSASVGAGSELKLEDAYTYKSIAQSLGIYVDKKIVSAGGGAFGINNEQTLYDNYFDWQKSLDTYPVVIGIKDSNSLYAIWELLDLNVEGASERYAELYGYFAEYGTESYSELCENYQITPSVAPTGITNIKVGDTENYKEGDIVRVKAGDTIRISFDVEPENANKYSKTFSVNNTSLATIDSAGTLTVLPNAGGGNYITVTLTAGTVSKQVTLYIINTFTVTFNTRVNGLDVPSLVGVIEGYSIEEPTLEREGWRLDGWFRDSDSTDRFDFENDSVTSNLTLYAKWTQIKPVVSFETGVGSQIDPITVAYNSSVAEPKKPALSGYIFGGWYEDDDYTVEYDFATPLKDDITIYAKWEKIEYTVSFVTNGGTPVADAATSITDGYKITEPKTVKTYYSLEGWYLDEYFVERFYFESEITENTTIYAKWSPVPAYVLPVDSDGESALYDENGVEIGVYTTDITKDFKLSVPTPHKEGYTFTGWYLNGARVDLASYADFKPIDGQHKLVARWSINSWTLTYVIDGETYGEPVSYKYGEEIFLVTPDKTGYTFQGWKYGNKPVPTVMPDCDVTLTGEFRANVHKVTYYIDDWFYDEDTCAFGEAIPLLTPEKLGYTFSGWKYGKKPVPDTMPDTDIMLIGSFIPNAHTVYYYLDDVLCRTEPCNYGDTIILPDFSKEGHTFSGWKYGTQSVPATMPDDDVTLTASLVPNEYILTYYVDGAIYGSPVKYKYGETIVYLADPTTEVDKKFSGWTYLNGELPVTMPAENVRIDGSFDQVLFTANYYIDGELYESVGLFVGSAVPDTVPVKIGHTFSGWLMKDGDTGALAPVPKVMPAGNIDIYGSFSVNSYTITFETLGGTEIGAINEAYGAAITKPADPDKTGYTFAGWDKEIPDTMPDGDITITAKWDINWYTITFDTDGGTSIEPIYRQYGASIVNLKPADPTKTGYTFAGWDKDIPDTMPAGDDSIKAKWNVNSYTITFNTEDGSEIESITGPYGSEIPPISAPTETGYTFDGWDKKIPETMPACDMTITATRRPNKYTVVYNPNNSDCNCVLSGSMKDSNLTYDLEATLRYNEYQLAGHKFIGWATSASGSVVYSNNSDVKNLTAVDGATVTLYAKWAPITYTVKYDINRPSCSCAVSGSMGNNTHTYHSTYTLPSCAYAITGHKFEGWATSKDGPVVYKNGANVSCLTNVDGGVVTLYAKWSLITYTITYSTNGGKSISSTTYTTHTAGNLSLPIAVYKTYADYNHFLGWYEDSSLNTKFVNNLKTDPRNLTLYAAWDLVSNVYNSMSGTPDISTERVIIDWSSITTADVKSARGTDTLTISKTTKELIIKGNPSVTYKNFRIVLSGFASGSEITLRLVDFKYTHTDVNLISASNCGSGYKLTIDVTGECSIKVGTSTKTITAIYLPDANIEVAGSGTLTVNGGNYISGGTSAGSGGNGVVASTVTIAMTKGTLNVNGGNGGDAYNRSVGDNDGDGSNGRDGYAGGAGGSAIKATTVTVKSGNLNAKGGNGGKGGNGSECNYAWGAEVSGGDGGDGGNGESAILASKFVISGNSSNTSVNVIGGDGGDSGKRGGCHNNDHGDGWADKGYATDGSNGIAGSGASALSSGCKTSGTSGIIIATAGENGEVNTALNQC